MDGIAKRLLLHPWFRLTRGLTLGVRAVLRDGEGRVLLIRHGYAPGWHLPGGGVEPGQSAADAMAQEFIEEAGIELLAPPALLSVHWHAPTHARDHVLVYRATQWRAGAPRGRVGEIAERGFFPMTALPEGTTRATRARLAETFEGAAPNGRW